MTYILTLTPKNYISSILLFYKFISYKLLNNYEKVDLKLMKLYVELFYILCFSLNLKTNKKTIFNYLK